MPALLVAAVVVALIGVGIAVETLIVHSKIAALGSQYTSFCDINEGVSCNRVLGSPFGKLFGIPVGWFAIATYSVIAAACLVARRRVGTAAIAPLSLAGLAVAGSAAFSLYMAAVSAFVLSTLCLLCTGLYAVAAVLAVIAVAVAREFERTWPKQRERISVGRFVGAFAASAVAVGLVAAAAWPRVGALSADMVSLEDVRKADPDFYAWYTNHPVAERDIAYRNVIGRKDAPVTIIEFADLQCGHCRKSHEKLKALLDRRPDEIRIVYKHFPLDAACNEVVGQTIHRHACRAAEATECAAKQDRFGEMLDKLFAHQSSLFDPTIMRLAREVGLDMEAFEACMASNATLGDVMADAREGERLNVKSTPTLYFNGREISGSFDSDVRYDYAVLIEAGLASASKAGS